MKLLHIDSSISGGQSVSRQLTASIVARLKQTTPGLEITYRDLAIAPVPHQSPTILFAKMKALYEAGSLADRKSTRLNSSHVEISYAVFCLKKKKSGNTDDCGEDPVDGLLLGFPHGLQGENSYCNRSGRVTLYFFFNDTATTEIYTLSLHDALPIKPAAS